MDGLSAPTHRKWFGHLNLCSRFNHFCKSFLPLRIARSSIGVNRSLRESKWSQRRSSPPACTVAWLFRVCWLQFSVTCSFVDSYDLVPTLCVGTPLRDTLRPVPKLAFKPGMRFNRDAERRRLSFPRRAWEREKFFVCHFSPATEPVRVACTTTAICLVPY